MMLANLAIVVLLLVPLGSFAASSRQLVALREDNWRDILNGEWMIKFYAPWCPACKDLKKTWDAFADWSKDLNVKVSSVDVTENPGLSGRFLVTALPTIYHVKDGVFRLYGGPRDKDDFISFIEEKKWTVVDSLASWKHPDTPQMAVVAMFFRMSMAVRDFHNYLVEQKGLPPAASYLCFGAATLLLGCILGFFIVCIIDCVFPASQPPATTAKSGKGKKQQKEQSEGDSQQSQSEGDEGESANDVSARQRKGEKGGKAVANGKPGSPEGKKKK